MVERISLDALKKIIHGGINDAATCVVKFYSNRCHYCHDLKPVYENISKSFDDVHFFVFNIEDDKNKEAYSIEGVPTICLVRTGNKTAIKQLPEPDEPDATTWYSEEQIVRFIKKEKLK